MTEFMTNNPHWDTFASTAVALLGSSVPMNAVFVGVTNSINSQELQ